LKATGCPPPEESPCPALPGAFGCDESLVNELVPYGYGRWCARRRGHDGRLADGLVLGEERPTLCKKRKG